MIAVGAILGGVVGELQVVMIENFGNEPEAVNALPEIVRLALHL